VQKANVLTCPFEDNTELRRLATSNKIVFLANGTDTEAFVPEPSDNTPRKKYGRELVEAAGLLRDRPNILISSISDGPKRIKLDTPIAMLQINPTFRTVYPNKVFDYKSCPRPTLLALDGTARTLACEQASAARMGTNGRPCVPDNPSRDALADRYLKTMEQTVGGSQPAAVPVPRERL